MACSKHLGMCRNHTFEMRAIQGQGIAIPAVAVEFCPIASSSAPAAESILPTFNRDGKYYTAGFTLPTDQHYADLNDIFEKDRFDRCVAGKLTANPNLLVPQPTNKHCHVCRVAYDDFLEHIDGDVHRANIRHSLGDRYIFDLCLPYKEQTRAKNQKLASQGQSPLATRSSTRIQEAYHRRREKETEVTEVSTMASLKNQKPDDFGRQLRFKTKRIHKMQQPSPRTTLY